MTAPQEKILAPEEAYLIERYGDNVVGLLKYGTMAFGIPHKNSVHDFWVIVRDLGDFHDRNAGFYTTNLNVPSTVEEQISANRVAPNFYALHENGLNMKIGVLSEHDFARLCRAKMMFVKGRMQKPLRVIRSTPVIDDAILSARAEGAHQGVSLCRRAFTMDEFLYQLCSLSYRAEIRPERKRAKVQSIVDRGRDQLTEIYEPLLAGFAYLDRKDDEYVDTRGPDDRRLARRKTLGYLRQCKWSYTTVRLIWRNYRTHSAPFKYVWHKILGEIEKGRNRRRMRKARTR